MLYFSVIVLFGVLVVLSVIVLVVQCLDSDSVVGIVAVVHWSAAKALYELFCGILVRLVLGLILVLEDRRLVFGCCLDSRIGVVLIYRGYLACCYGFFVGVLSALVLFICCCDQHFLLKHRL